MQDNQETVDVHWRLHLRASPKTVFDYLATNEGRGRYWAETAIEQDGVIHFHFPGDLHWKGEILECVPPHRFKVRYYGGTTTTFALETDDVGGTDLLLTDEGIARENHCEVMAGWVSVLLALKAVVDFSADLRNHDPQRTWSQGYVDN